VVLDLQTRIRQEYEYYNNDKFIVSRNQSHLFESRMLHQRLRQDVDLMTSWMTDVAQAKEEQLLFRERAAKAAKNFFFPLQKPSPTSTTDNTSSLALTKTSAWEDSSYSDTSITTKTYFDEPNNGTRMQMGTTIVEAKRGSVR
jgi:hypothetical protein